MSVGENLAKEERPPYIQFERRAIENKRMTLETGSWVGKEVDYVFVTNPGGRDVYSSRVESWLERQETNSRKGKIKPEWLDYYRKSYEKFKAGEELPVNGTPIKGWSSLSPAQTKLTISLGILTVEDLAALNDEGLRRLGMGGRDLVNKAKAWMKSVNDHGGLSLENANLLKINTVLEETVASLEEKVHILSQQVQSMDQTENAVLAPSNFNETITADDLMPEEVSAAAIKELREVEIVPEISEIDHLRQMHIERFGKKAHPASKIETLRKKLGV